MGKGRGKKKKIIRKMKERNMMIQMQNPCYPSLLSFVSLITLLLFLACCYYWVASSGFIDEVRL